MRGGVPLEREHRGIRRRAAQCLGRPIAVVVEGVSRPGAVGARAGGLNDRLAFQDIREVEALQLPIGVAIHLTGAPAAKLRALPLAGTRWILEHRVEEGCSG